MTISGMNGFVRNLQEQQARHAPIHAAQREQRAAEQSASAKAAGGGLRQEGPATTAVSSAAAASSAAGDTPLHTLEGLSPEMVLALVRQRMDDLDLQIHSRSAEILRSTETARALSAEIQALEAIKAKAVSQGGKDPSIRYDHRGSDNLVSIDGGNHTVAEVARRYGVSDAVEGLVKDGKISASALSDLIESRRQELQRVNSGNEIRMMELQQLMQRRAEILSLGSNLLRTFHEATQQIVRNVGA
jgi:hypothetical protein